MDIFSVQSPNLQHSERQQISFRFFVNRYLLLDELAHAVAIDVDEGEGRARSCIDLLHVFVKESVEALEIGLGSLIVQA